MQPHEPQNNAGAGSKSGDGTGTKTPDPKRAKQDAGTTKEGVGAHGSREKPKTDDAGQKWPGGGKKGEDE